MAMDMTVGMRIAASVSGGSSVDDLRKSVEKLNGQASGIGNAFKTAGTLVKGFIGIEAIRRVADFSMELFKSADALDELSERTGVSASLLSSYSQSAKMAGVEIEGVATGLKKLSVNLVDAQNGSKEAARGFQALRLDPSQFKNSNEALAAIADRFARMEDGANKVAIATALMGKAGEANIPWLNQGAEAMGKYAAIFTPEFMAMSSRFTDEIDIMEFSFKRSAATILEKFLPTFTQIAQSFNALTNTKSDFIGFFDVLAEGFRLIAAAAQVVIAGFRQLLEVLSTIYDVSAFTLSGQFEAAGKRIQEGFKNTLEVGRQGMTEFKNLMKDSLTFGDGTTAEILARQREAAGANKEERPKDFKANMSSFNKGAQGELDKIEKFRIAQEQANKKLIDEMNAVNMSTLEYQKLTAARELDTKAAEMAVGMSESGKAKLKEVTEALKEQTEATIALKYETERTFEYGAKQAFKTYLEDVGNMAKQSQELFSKSFKGMEDALVNFVMTGKFNFKDLANSILADMARIAIRQAIMKPLMGALGGALGFPLPFANGGIMTSEGSVPLKRYATGGIATSPQLAMFGEGSTPEAYVPLPDGRNIPVKMQGGAGDVNNVTVNVSVEGGRNNETANNQEAKSLGSAISKAVQSELLKQKQPGGLLYGNR